MQFRDLQKQYQILKKDIDRAIDRVFTDGNFISGKQVAELEEQLAAYVGVKYCITCGNGRDAASTCYRGGGPFRTASELPAHPADC